MSTNKKIIIITGSPRKKGNTATLIRWVAEGAKHAGASVEVVDATLLQFKAFGCTACMDCQKGDYYKCSIDDDATALVRKLPFFDWVVLASPVYFMGFSAQLKAVVDRMHCLLRYDPAQQRFHHPFVETQFGLIAASGADANGGLNVLELGMSQIMDVLGKTSKNLLVPLTPMNEGEIEGRVDLKKRALAYGTELAGS